MKTIIFSAFALAFAVPAAAQTAPAADPHAGHAKHQTDAPQGQKHEGHAQRSMKEMHKHCQEMMKGHGKGHGAKSGTSSAPNQGGHGDHKGH